MSFPVSTWDLLNNKDITLPNKTSRDIHGSEIPIHKNYCTLSPNDIKPGLFIKSESLVAQRKIKRKI